MISGVVTDSTGALVPGAMITLTESDGRQQTTTSDGAGHYSFSMMAAGSCRIRVTAPGFSVVDALSIEAASGRSVVRNIQMELAVVQQNVEVLSSPSIDTDPSTNASAITLKGDALQSLSDDPDDLAQDLQSLAGPSTGPEGGEIFVDGFSGAKLPPRSAIREIRVNQNPFSAQYDKLGYGRIEIFTKPGADAYHGELRFNLGDSAFNSRNPFAPVRPDYQRRTIEGTIGGPIGARTSFNVQVERRDIGQAALINALVLDPGFNTVPYRTSISDPRINTEIGGRLDYQLTPNHTLVARYEWEKDDQTNAGLDTFSMPSRGYYVDEREQVLQLTETAVLGASAVNDVRFQYRRSHDGNRAVSAAPAIEVPDTFVSGGTSMSLNGLLENRYEMQESLLLSRGEHTLRFRGRVRGIQEENASGSDYNGVFTFTSLDAYRITEQGLLAGMMPAEIRALGGGASQFSIAAGDPVARITQLDFGLFAQDDWRVRNNFTLSGGLRYERQTNIDDWRSWAPRLGLAWGIPGRTPDKPFAVVRAGFGLFYERVGETIILDTRRLDGIHQKQFLISNPDFYPTVPPLESLSAFAQEQAVRRLDSRLRAPGTMQLALSLERQLPRNAVASLSFVALGVSIRFARAT
ncbi:MAG: TonB-dependent receptor domain-containing protein [Acidobacteriota bacterium]